MDRSRAIDALGQALQDAASRADWDGLAQAVRELGPRLLSLIHI